MTYFKTLRLMVLFIPLIILYSCEFQSKEEYFVDIQTPVSKSTIDLGTTADSIYIYDLTDLNYSFSGNGHNLYGMTVYFDEVKLQGDFYQKGKITIDPLKHTNGLHTLKMVYQTSTSSGSMADVYKAEVMVTEKKFKIVIDNIPPAKPVLKSVYFKNGTMMIEWEKLNKFNFKTLKVNARYNGALLNSTSIKKDTAIFKDETYTGGKVDYEIEIVGYNYSLKSNIKSFDTISFKNIQAEVIDPTHIKVTWDDPVVYNNVSSIKIFGSSINSYSYTTTAPVKGSAIINYNLALGELLPVRVALKGKTNIETEQFITNLYLGQSAPKYLSAQTYYDKATNSYFSIHPNNPQLTKDPDPNNLYVYKSNRETLEVSAYQLIGETDNITYFLSITTNGFGYVYFQDEIIKFNLDDLSIVQRIPFEEPYATEITYFKVTDNNLLVIRNTENIRIIDLNNGNVIHYAEPHFDIAASNDGKFIYYNGTFFNLTSEHNLVAVMQVEEDEYQEAFVKFMPDKPGMCLVDNYPLNQLELYDLNSKTSTVVYSNENINVGKVYYDLFKPDYAIVKGLFNITIVNYKTKKTQILPITNESSEYDTFYYSGGRLFIVYGHKYDINFNF